MAHKKTETNPKGGGRNVKHSEEDVLAVMDGCGAIVSALAKKLGVSWNTADSYIKKYPKVAEEWEAQKEEVLDLTEGKLIEQIQAGEGWAIKFMLGTKGKKRGYVQKQEIDLNARVQTVVVDDV